MYNHKSVYEYGVRLLEKFPDLAVRFLTGTMVPDQVEIHLPPRGKNRCWLNCPHCYLRNRLAGPVRMRLSRLLQVIQEIAGGHPITREMPEKLILSDMVGDPLNSAYVEPVVLAAKKCGFVLGIHTKALILTRSLIGALTCENREGDYISVSVDAGSDAVFNVAHGVRRHGKLFTRITRNLARLVRAKCRAGSGLNVVATYLVTSLNCRAEEIQRFATTILSIGVDRIRFSEPIRPVMGHEQRSPDLFPEARPEDLRESRACIADLIAKNPGRVHYLEFPPTPVRVLPCYSRWLQPTIGDDGYLYPCCLTACDLFPSFRLADLTEVGFWDSYLADADLDFISANCQCDRKAARINDAVARALGCRTAESVFALTAKHGNAISLAVQGQAERAGAI